MLRIHPDLVFEPCAKAVPAVKRRITIEKRRFMSVKLLGCSFLDYIAASVTTGPRKALTEERLALS